MSAIKEADLLNDKDILAEINRYKWIESEKAGYDIGLEQASREWIKKYSSDYLHHNPNKTFSLFLKASPLVNFLTKEIRFE